MAEHVCSKEGVLDQLVTGMTKVDKRIDGLTSEIKTLTSIDGPISKIMVQLAAIQDNGKAVTAQIENRPMGLRDLGPSMNKVILVALGLVGTALAIVSFVIGMK